MKSYVIICLFMFATPCLVMAQNDIIFQVKVIDKDSIAIQGASLNILNSQYNGTTNKDGMVVFKNLLPGTYVLNISKSDYAEINTEITIKSEPQYLTIGMQLLYEQLGEVTVTAQKREEPVQQLPVSITALSTKQIENWRLWTINDLTAISPNLFAGDPGDKRSVTSIRGIVTTSYDPAVATYIDGVNQFGLDSYISQLYDVERIEILRGPQGTLYGRNAMGGVINIITKKPQNKTTVSALGSIGNYNSLRFSPGIKTALIKDKLYLGISGMFESTDGFYLNEFNDSHYDKQHSLSGNYYLKYLVSDKWNLTLNYKHVQNRNSGPFPLVTDAEEAIINPYILSQNAITKMFDNTKNASASLTYSGNNFNFNSQSAFQSNYRFYNDPIDADFSPLDIITIINDFGNKWNNGKVYTQEFKFSSAAKSNERFNWVAGVYFFHQDNPVKQATHFGEDAMLAGMSENNFSLISTSTSKTNGMAVYGQSTFRVASKLDIIAGLRYDYEHKKLNVYGEYQRDPDPVPLFAFQSDTTATADFTALSPKLGIDYHITENNHAYVTYSQGFRAGGLTPLSSDPSQPPLYKFKPERSSSMEAGFKNSFFTKRMTLNLSLFLTSVNDVQVPTLILPEAVTITKNTGKLQSKGMEVEMTALVVSGLQVDYNFGYTHATFDAFKLSSDNTEINLAGNRQVFTPDITSMLAIQYNLKIGKGSNNLFLRSEWRYLGNQYFDIENTIKQNPYSIINASLGFNLKQSTLSFWIRNLSDKKYILYAYDFGAVHLGSPLTCGTTLSIKI
ncbi:TonB-dependent receptor [Gelidibacter gilvus]|uniref:TonB-dependent receptor n=1 Tax=Gelidibacter gilvus TaxID=59602 RepID=A0A4Q0XEX9_9FLAO|nr:TonB-dependent receptor [Gelidibacter gilvus]RXJ49570.1 TonB-dependent receptor [Gelidibacter gilvus]